MPSTNMLLFIQRLKILCRERLGNIVNVLKEFKYENSSAASSVYEGGKAPRTVLSDGGSKSIRDDRSEG